MLKKHERSTHIAYLNIFISDTRVIMEEKYDHHKQQEEQIPRLSASDEDILRMTLGRRRRIDPDVDNEWQAFREKNMPFEVAPQKRNFPVGAIVKIAVSMAAMLLVSWLFYRPKDSNSGMQVFTASDERMHQVTLCTDDDAPASVRQSIDFSSLVRARTRTATVHAEPSEAQQLKMLTMATSRGMDYTFVLPDSTRVCLNAESSLRFPEQFSGNLREVELKGEAYFEVTPDASRPFVVKTANLVTRVYGTAFDVVAYPGMPARVILVSGKVSAQVDQEAAVMMRPGELYGADKDGNWKKQQVDTYLYVQWKDGFFYFDQTPLVDIMRTLGRWYNMNIVFENVGLAQVRLHFVAEKRQPINEIVAALNSLGVGKVTIGDNVITIE